jgi:hypothetical protein
VANKIEVMKSVLSGSIVVCPSTESFTAVQMQMVYRQAFISGYQFAKDAMQYMRPELSVHTWECASQTASESWLRKTAISAEAKIG